MSRPRNRTRVEDLYRNGGHVRTSSALQFLRELTRYRYELKAIHGDAVPHTWLIRFRKDLRLLEEQRAGLVIQRFLSVGSRDLRHVFIWLLSKSASRFFLLGIDEYCDDPSPMVRKHVAKALRRLEAWPLLAEMAAAHPEDERLRWFATAPTTKRPFSDRLRDFRTTVDNTHAREVVTPSQMSFWAKEKSWSRTPPKSVAIIRRMLRRIRHWVRWGVTG